MSSTADTLLVTALNLPADERAWLAEELIASLDHSPNAEIEEAWAIEIERRINEVQTSEAQTSTWENARARIQTKLTKA